MQIGSIIKFQRRARGMKQKEMAEKIGVTPSYLNRIENGRTKPKMPLIRKLATLFNMRTTELILMSINPALLADAEDSAALQLIVEPIVEYFASTNSSKSIKN